MAKKNDLVNRFRVLEKFEEENIDPSLSWLNPPPHWKAGSGCLTVRTAPGSDFWQRTHYGFQRDSGHLLRLFCEESFLAETRVRFVPVHRYDQAGLMVRFSPDCWLKASVEFEPDGPSKLGVVVTNRGYSDWSIQLVDPKIREASFRVIRSRCDYTVESTAASELDREFSPIRVCHLEGQGRAECGVYACSPEGEGLKAEFEYLSVGPGPGSAPEA